MGVLSFDEEVSSKVAPSRLFKALILDNHNLVPQIAPQFIKSASIIQGDGGVGTIKQVFFGDDAPFKYIKTQIDELDQSNFTCKYTLIEGGELNETLKSITFESKFEADAEGGCVAKLKRVFHLAEGGEISQEQLEDHKARADKLFKGVEGYLLANPEAYA